MREQLEEHRKNPTCASCHRRMDPLGFGLENFDAVGAWRTMDGKFPIDSTGTLPDGRTFNGPEELRAILTADRAGLRACADVEAADVCARPRPRALRQDGPVSGIVSRLPEHEYRFSALVLEIVKSLPFQSRRAATRSEHAP